MAQTWSGYVRHAVTNQPLAGITVRAKIPNYALYITASTNSIGYWETSAPTPPYNIPGEYRWQVVGQGISWCSGANPIVIPINWSGSGIGGSNINFTISNPAVADFQINGQTAESWQVLSFCNPTSLSFTNTSKHSPMYRLVVYNSDAAGNNLGALPCSQQYNGCPGFTNCGAYTEQFSSTLPTNILPYLNGGAPGFYLVQLQAGYAGTVPRGCSAVWEPSGCNRTMRVEIKSLTNTANFELVNNNDTQNPFYVTPALTAPGLEYNCASKPTLGHRSTGQTCWYKIQISKVNCSSGLFDSWVVQNPTATNVPNCDGSALPDLRLSDYIYDQTGVGLYFNSNPYTCYKVTYIAGNSCGQTTKDGYFKTGAGHCRLANPDQPSDSENPAGPSVVVYPNPASGKTNLNFTLENSQPVTLNIRNITGQLVASPLQQTMRDSGAQQVEVDLTNLPAGVYIYELIADKKDIGRFVKVD